MWKRFAPLIVALALATLAVVLVLYQVTAYKREATAGWELEKVLVAATDLQPGAPLNPNVVRVDEMPRKFVYDSVLGPADSEFAYGREVVVPLKAGEPIHWYQLRGVRALEQLAKAVPRRQRAISISVTERSAVGHWIRPNDTIDVLGSFRDPGTSETVVVTLLQNIIVLATGQTTGSTQGIESDTQYSTVTLLVDPEEAEVLVLAQELGSLYFSLRNVEDMDVLDEEKRGRTTLSSLLAGERLKQARERRYRQNVVIQRGMPGDRRGGR